MYSEAVVRTASVGESKRIRKHGEKESRGTSGKTQHFGKNSQRSSEQQSSAADDMM